GRRPGRCGGSAGIRRKDGDRRDPEVGVGRVCAELARPRGDDRGRGPACRGVVAKTARRLTPDRYLRAGIARFSPPIRAIANATLARLRALMPGANEFIYDNYNAFVVGFGPNDRPSDAVFSVVVYPKQVNLGFIHGAVLDDPDKVLQGSGTQFRHIKLIPDASVLDRPEVGAVMARAIADADAPFDPRHLRSVSVRMIAKKRRPRRP